jgi:hypothetical protein
MRYDMGKRDRRIPHNTIRPMTKLIAIESTDKTTWRVMPRWRGRNLAVHAPVIGGECRRRPGQWVITHLASGHNTGGHFYGTLREAIMAARFWDDHFGDVTAANASRWPLKDQWLRIIRNGYAERPFRSLSYVREVLAQA